MPIEKHVRIDPRYLRPTETNELVADPAKAQQRLGWKPKIRFGELVKIMIDAELRKAGLEPIGEGDETIEGKFPDKWWKDD